MRDHAREEGERGRELVREEETTETRDGMCDTCVLLLHDAAALSPVI